MLSGAITKDGLVSLLRSLSQKRRQGVLELSYGDQELSVTFSAGKVVEANASNAPVVATTLRKLCAAGLISEDEMQLSLDSNPDIAQLYAALVDTGKVLHEDFVKAKHASEFDVLYSLRNVSGGEYNFHPQIVKLNEDLSIAVSPGQLLLDMFELENEEERFEKIFGDLSDDTLHVAAKETANVHLSESEQMIWDQLGVESCLGAVCDATLLTEYQVREGLLALYSKNLIGIYPNGVGLPSRKNGSATSVLTEETVVEMPEADELIDKAADLLKGIAPDAELIKVKGQESSVDEEDIEEKVRTELAGSLGISTQILKAVSSTAKQNDISGKEKAGTVTPVVAEKKVRLETEALSEEELDDEEFVYVARESLFGRVQEVLINWNYQLLDTKTVQRTCLGVVFIYLLVLGFFVPEIINRWFSALEYFSSPR